MNDTKMVKSKEGLEHLCTSCLYNRPLGSWLEPLECITNGHWAQGTYRSMSQRYIEC